LWWVFSDKMGVRGFNNITRWIQHAYNAPAFLWRELNGATLDLTDRIVHVLTFMNQEPTTLLWHFRKHTRDRALHTIKWAINTVAWLQLAAYDLLDTGINSGLDAAAWAGKSWDGFRHRNGVKSTINHFPAKIINDLEKTFLTEGLLSKNPKSWSGWHFSPMQVLSQTEQDDIYDLTPKKAKFQPTVPWKTTRWWKANTMVSTPPTVSTEPLAAAA
jgi:hypothetical protein